MFSVAVDGDYFTMIISEGEKHSIVPWLMKSSTDNYKLLRKAQQNKNMFSYQIATKACWGMNQ